MSLSQSESRRIITIMLFLTAHLFTDDSNKEWIKLNWIIIIIIIIIIIEQSVV
jgi:uncharacterized membrane protein YfhO